MVHVQIIAQGIVFTLAIVMYLSVYTICRHFGDDLTWRTWSLSMVRDHAVMAIVVAAMYGMGLLVNLAGLV